MANVYFKYMLDKGQFDIGIVKRNMEAITRFSTNNVRAEQGVGRPGQSFESFPSDGRYMQPYLYQVAMLRNMLYKHWGYVPLPGGFIQYYSDGVTVGRYVRD